MPKKPTQKYLKSAIIFLQNSSLMELFPASSDINPTYFFCTYIQRERLELIK